ncbi:MAG TPA: hypothetical protein P5089_03395 [Candidatus Portnoybacteria bacterium]|nr:hypothetical protein [Candidatus Portnoybacteria bacterium]
MSRLQRDPCPVCGKGEIDRIFDTFLDHREKCPFCQSLLSVPSDKAKPITVIERAEVQASVN